MAQMTSKERVHAALEGRAVDRMPVAVLYSNLYHLDHFSELTGRPQWEAHKWTHAPPEEHLRTYRQLLRLTPFDLLEPLRAPSREDRENTEFVFREGRPVRHDKRDDTFLPLTTVSGHAGDYSANQTRCVFSKQDADEHVKIWRAEQLLAAGVNDYLDATVAALGKDHFLLSGMACVLYACHIFVGLTNLFAMLIEEPDLIDYLCGRILEQNLENIRSLAAGGGDGIFLDDAMATSDMISVAHYERFSLPYVKEMVREVHRLGQKAILIYYGGIADRLEQIASTGADGLLMETSMKGYVNDLEAAAETIGDRMTLFGNLDPIGILQNGSDEELEAEIRRQVAAGKKARGFIISTGSPITPLTPLSRVQTFIRLARELGAAAPG
jgi:uroporphyrinogen-III decarboxylase